MSRATTSWAVPDPVRGPDAASAADSGPGYGTPPPARHGAGPDLPADVRAGVAATVALVLLGAPVGLLWALLAPKVSVVVSDSSVVLAGVDRSAFIAGDAAFLAIVATVGLVTGVLAWVLGRRHGPALVVGLTVGGLLAAYVASRTGGLLHEGDAREALDAGRSGAVELAVKLRASEAMLGWPIAALVGFLVPSALFGDDGVSSG